MRLAASAFSLFSYSRFVHLKKNLFVSLFAYLLSKRGEITGIAFIDSTSIDVCHNKRIKRNRVFKGLAKRDKTTSGWFYGFKLHLIINEKGEILAFQLTPGNMADVSVVETLSRGIVGKLSDNPRPYGSIKLSVEEFYRIRCDDYRIIYKIFDDRLIVLLLDIDSRKDVYKKMRSSGFMRKEQLRGHWALLVYS